MLEVRPEAKRPLLVGTVILGIPINFPEESGIVPYSSVVLSAPLEVSKGCEALCPEEFENYGFL